MKLQILVIGILVSSGIILLYSVTNLELAEQYFENVRNGLACQKPGSSCPFPDFEDPMFYGMIGLAIFSIGAILFVSKDRSKAVKLILGIMSVVAGVPPLVFSILAYADDYRHFELIMRHCSPTSRCMYPDVFANIQYVKFFGIYSIILLTIGAIILSTHFRGRHKK